MSFNTLSANQTWFDFSVQSTQPGIEALSVYAFSGEEAVSTPYEFTIELVSRNSSLNLTSYLGKEALLTIADRSGKKREVHGVIRQMEQLHTGNAFTMYRCALTPRLWFLGQTREHRIYQHQSVVEIIKTVLTKHNFVPESYDFKLRETYPEREYAVQYFESDLHFLQRLCEEEGITYHFEHSKKGHCLCFCDAEGGAPIPGESRLRFYPGSGNPADTAVISRLNLRHRINSDSASYNEWNFTRPALDLTSKARERDMVKAPVPLAMSLETYQFPHLYQEPDKGARYAHLQLQRQLTFREWVECESDVSRHTPGFTFTLHDHPRPDANRGWWIVSVSHKGEQPQVLEHEAPDSRGLMYNATVVALPDDTRFVPENIHKKVRIEGLQSAIVTGPAGEEVFTDKWGRVKVQFHWDRLGKHDENTTCWVRVADPWAGNNFGFIHVPRIGQETLVEFMEGDPDRPVITGRTYNTDLMPPWQLPEQKTLSGIQSREFKAERRNQLVMDDTQGQIQTQLSSDHNLSQLNLGYVTRINHIQGRADFRGEGTELRTDGWGVIRAAKGMFISTDTRASAQNHHKDMAEAVGNLQGAVIQHEETAKLAQSHKAQEGDPDVSAMSKALHTQADQVRGLGKTHEELTAPHMVLSSPAGIALTTPASAHIHTGEHTAVSTGHHLSVSTGKSFLASALDKVSIFSHKLGMRLFAAKGKVEIQAQSNDLDVIAEKVASFISANGGIRISAPKEIYLAAGGSYIKINRKGIEKGTNGKFAVYSKSKIMSGPREKDYLNPALPKGDLEYEVPPDLLKFTLLQAPGHPPLANEQFIIHCNGEEIERGYTDEIGQFGFEPKPGQKEYELEMVNGHRFTLNIADAHSDGQEGRKEILGRDGFRTFVDAEHLNGEDYVFDSWHSLHGAGNE